MNSARTLLLRVHAEDNQPDGDRPQEEPKDQQQATADQRGEGAAIRAEDHYEQDEEPGEVLALLPKTLPGGEKCG